jgi:hypothetical protein
MFCNVWYVKLNVVDEVNGRPAYLETLATKGMSNQSYTPPVGVAMH